MAHVDQSNEWARAYSPSLAEFESLARESYARLPGDFRALTGEVVILLADFPSDEIFEDMALETPFDLLGLFQGVPMPDDGALAPTVTNILLFKRNLVMAGPKEDLLASEEPVVKQFLRGSTRGPIGMSEERDRPELL